MRKNTIQDKDAAKIFGIGMMHLLEPSEGIVVDYLDTHRVIYLSDDGEEVSIDNVQDLGLTASTGEEIVPGMRIWIRDRSMEN